MSRLHETVGVAPMAGYQRTIMEAAPTAQVGEILGGGCIAQVYAGEFYENPSAIPTPVAIKVRRPEVKRLMRTDMLLLKWGAQVAEWLKPDLRWLALEKVVDNFGWYMQQQTNLTIEASHLMRLANDFPDGSVRDGTLRVPRVITATEDVLVTTMARGMSLSKYIMTRPREPVRKALFHAMTDAMARMILKTKFIHGDLHPGNMFVFVPEGSTKPELTLIDAGIAIEMSQDLADMAYNSAKAAIFRDAKALGEAILGLHKGEGLCDFGVNLEDLESEVGSLILAGCFLCDKVKDKEIWNKNFNTYEEYRASRVSEYFTLMVGALSNHKVRVSPSLWSVMTAFALIEGSVQELGHGVNVMWSAKPYIFRPMDFIGKMKSWY